MQASESQTIVDCSGKARKIALGLKMEETFSEISCLSVAISRIL